MKIAFFEIEPWEQVIFKNAFKNHTLLFFDHEVTPAILSKIKDVDILCVFIYSHITQDILNHIPKLKLLCTLSTGYDHIDIAACAKRKITVCNVPFYGENTVAEHTFALILSLSRKIVDAVERTKKDDFSLKGLRGFDLKGKTLGVIGPGHIGQHVIRMAQGFEMNVIAYAPKQDAALAKKCNFRYAPLEKLLKTADIITIHCPLTPKTKHLNRMQNIKRVKKGAYLINTARGEIVDTQALLYALDRHLLAGAGLDVLEGECDIKEEKQMLHKKFIAQCDLRLVLENHMILKKHNVLVTPHNAFNSTEALYRILDTTVENIQKYLKKKPINIIKN